MRTTKQLSITLTHEMAEMVRDGLRALQAHQHALDVWLRENVALAYDAMKADPSRAVSTVVRIST